MKHYILSALLLAGLAGCKSSGSDPTPTPAPAATVTLQTRWQLDSTWRTASPTASRTNIQALTSSGEAWVFTDTQWQVYAGSTLDKQQSYTRSGNLIVTGTASTDQNTILTLNASRLVIRTPNPYGTLTTITAHR